MGCGRRARKKQWARRKFRGQHCREEDARLTGTPATGHKASFGTSTAPPCSCSPPLGGQAGSLHKGPRKAASLGPLPACPLALQLGAERAEGLQAHHRDAAAGWARALGSPSLPSTKFHLKPPLRCFRLLSLALHLQKVRSEQRATWPSWQEAPRSSPVPIPVSHQSKTPSLHPAPGLHLRR